MTAKVIAAEITRTIHPGFVPEGEWPGFWGGYIVDVVIEKEHYRLQADAGIRTPKAPCVVKSHRGTVTVEVVA